MDTNPLSYVIRHDLFPEIAAKDPMCGTVGRNFFTINEVMIARRPIIDVTEVAGTDNEKIGPFTNDYMSNRTRVWDKLCAIFQKSEAWTYCKSGKNHRGDRIAFKAIYNDYLGT